MDLAQEISAFHRILPSLRAEHREGWLVIVGETFEGSFASFEAAAKSALERFPDREFLIRHTDDVQAEIPFIVVDG